MKFFIAYLYKQYFESFKPNNTNVTIIKHTCTDVCTRKEIQWMSTS